MPFTGDSSDSESDGEGNVNVRSISGTRLDSTNLTTEKPNATKPKGITPTIINQPPTPLLSRKKPPPCSLNQGPDEVAGYYDQSIAAPQPASPLFSSKNAKKILDADLTNLDSLKSRLNNRNNINTNVLQDEMFPAETKPSSTFLHTNPNGFIPSSPHSAKTPTRSAVITSSFKKFGTS